MGFQPQLILGIFCQRKSLGFRLAWWRGGGSPVESAISAASDDRTQSGYHQRKNKICLIWVLIMMNETEPNKLAGLERTHAIWSKFLHKTKMPPQNLIQLLPADAQSTPAYSKGWKDLSALWVSKSVPLAPWIRTRRRVKTGFGQKNELWPGRLWINPKSSNRWNDRNFGAVAGIEWH